LKDTILWSEFHVNFLSFGQFVFYVDRLGSLLVIQFGFGAY